MTEPCGKVWKKISSWGGSGYFFKVVVERRENLSKTLLKKYDVKKDEVA